MEPVQLEEALETFSKAVDLVKVSLGAVEPMHDRARVYLTNLQKNIQKMTVEDIEESLYILCDK